MLVKYLFLIALIMQPVSAPAAIIQIPQTGQSKCFDTDGFEIPCAGTGQDGDIQAGMVWPNPRFRDNGNQTMTDDLTGLTWTKDANLMKTRDPAFDSDSTAGDGQIVLLHALDYIKKLNTENYQGFSDWRLPNINEMKSIAGKQQSDNAGWLNSQGFINSQAGQYWSTTTAAFDTTYDLTVDISNGDVNGRLRPSEHFAWPVRGGLSANGTSNVFLPQTRQVTCYDNPSTLTLASLYPPVTINCAGSGQDGEFQVGAEWPNPRFHDKGDQTITDTLTGLTWTKDAQTPYLATCGYNSTLTWQGSLSLVKCLNQIAYLNKSNWRLPNINELEILVNRSQSNIPGWLNSQGFFNVKSTFYWSSTTEAALPNKAKSVSFYSGIVSSNSKTDSYYVWPVCGGIQFAVTPSAGNNGSLSPSTVQTVSSGATSSFTAIPASGYQIATATGCSGTLTGNIYTTGPITGACTVSVGFSAIPGGDLTRDGKVDIRDALMTLKMAVGLISIDSATLAVGDVAPLVNGIPAPDGKIDIRDALLILKKCVGLINW